MRTFFLLALLGVVLVFQNCKKEETLPIYEVADVALPELASNDIDRNRLCLAEVFARMLDQEDFRQYLREQSINPDEDWNEEFLLIQHLDDLVTTDLTFLEVVEQAIAQQVNGCFTSVSAFRDALLSDPLLVLKLPDVIPAEEWDASSTVPFLYAKTLAAYRYPADPEARVGWFGLHPSGAVDSYQFGEPRYFPLVLKHSEDYVAVDENLQLQNGTKLSDLYSDIPTSVYGGAFFEQLEQIPNSNFYLIRLTDLINQILTARSIVFEPNASAPCGEACSNDCIPQEDRRLLATDLTIHIQNETALEYLFSEYYRAGGQALFSENLLPLILTRQLSDDNSYDWNRHLLGSYRLVDLFLASNSHSVNYVNFSVDGNNTALPEFSSSASVSGTQQVSLPNLLLAQDFVAGDILRYASYRIKLEVISTPFLAEDGEDVTVYDFSSGTIQNYSLTCSIPSNLGFNSTDLLTSY